MTASVSRRLTTLAQIEAEGARLFADVKPGVQGRQRAAELLSAALMQQQEKSGSDERMPAA